MDVHKTLSTNFFFFFDFDILSILACNSISLILLNSLQYQLLFDVLCF